MDSKKRATNFSSTEESLLVELVTKHKSIIECKKSDTNSLRLKTETWIKLSKFNSLSGEVYRDAKILKSKYDNLKKRAKHKFAEEKSYQLSTGGGPSQDFRIDAIDNSIKDLIGTQITGFPSMFDDDSEINMLQTPTIIFEEVIEPQVQETCSGVSSEIVVDHCYVKQKEKNDNIPEAPSSVDHCYAEEKKTNDWSKYTPQMLRTPISTRLQNTASTSKQGKRLPFTKNPLTRKMIGWAESKVALAELQKECYLEQHHLKMKLMREEHEEKLKLLRRESDVRIDIMRQTNKLDI